MIKFIIFHHRSSAGSSSSYGGGGGGGRTYADNSYNRQFGMVGLPHGTEVISSRGSGASGSSGGTYVDNPYNRSVGRVGMPHGTAVISRSDNSSLDGAVSKLYVDNPYNRSVGRVGMPHGTAVISKSDSSSSSSGRVYVDNALNCRLERVGAPIGIGKQTALYKDNDFNRNTGRAGKPLGSVPVSGKCKETKILQRIFQSNNIDIDINLDQPEYAAPLNEMKHMMNRDDEEKSYKERSRTTSAPKTELQKIKNLEIIPYENIQLGKQIGEGGFGVVYFAHLQGSVIAVKKLRVQRVSRSRLDAFTDEVKLLNKLDHPNIVKFIGACITTPNLAICLEYMDMTVYDAIHIKEIPFSTGENLQKVRVI